MVKSCRFTQTSDIFLMTFTLQVSSEEFSQLVSFLFCDASLERLQTVLLSLHRRQVSFFLMR